jgi:DNA-binding GntR family transcriptional regulator
VFPVALQGPIDVRGASHPFNAILRLILLDEFCIIFTVHTKGKRMIINNVGDSTYTVIKNRILDGYYPPGIHLVESDLIKEYNVSRISVREALHRLIGDDLVEQIPHRGIRVRHFTLEDINEIYILRGCLDSLSAGLLAKNQNMRIINELQKIMDKDKKAVDDINYPEHLKLMFIYHQLVQEGSENKALIKICERLSFAIMLSKYTEAHVGKMQEFYEDHVEILNAIIDKNDKRAEELMRRHMHKSRIVVMNYYSKSGELGKIRNV